MLPADTLLYDTAKIAEYQADKRFDYNSQLRDPEVDLIEMLTRWLSRYLDRFFGAEMTGSITAWFLVAFFALAVGLAVYFVYKKRPELFTREKKNPLPYGIEEENIYGIDFEKELAAALAAGDFRMAIRVLYLQTLRFIADKQWIDWQIYKTPTEYTYELKPVALKASFRDFTNRFLQVRYGNFKATREWFDTMRRLQDELRKGGKDEDDGE
ncbi:MAG: DUF4129 domain-containing protein [Tannerella sp.]|jgi:hypothetical protein|nr:DUF4129 domain-containing protein [Tannerella sp.]